MIKYYMKTVIYPVILLMLLSSTGLAQQPVLTGSVRDVAGKPIQDAKIALKDQPGINTKTDKEGRFSISAQAGQKLEIVTTDNRFKTIRVSNTPLEVIIDGREQSVPIGFGLERSDDEVTSAIGIVRSDELSKSSAINPANALFGRIPGLAVMQNGGTSWENDPNIYIRGLGTNSDASILVLVDGFERPLSSLSLPEIESVAVLKDAAALALYGQRGANGVLLVTTKRGYGQGINIKFSYERGVTQAFRLPEFLDASGYAMAVNEARANDGLSPLYSSQDLTYFNSGSSRYLFPNVNWFKETFRDFGSTDNFNATFQGNTKTIRYFSLLNYQTDNGLLGPVHENKGYNTQLKYTKVNFRTNLDVDLTLSTKLKFSVAGNLRGARQPGRYSSSIMSALYSVPSALFPVKTYGDKWGGLSSNATNPVAQVSATGYILNYSRELLADLRLEQKLDFILPGLSAEGALAYDNSASYVDNNTRQFQIQQVLPIRNTQTGMVMDSIKSLYGTNTELAFSSSLSNQWRSISAWGKINYSRDWEDNSLRALLLYQQSKLVGNGQFSTFLNQSLAGNIHYAKAEKYFADLTVAYGGSNIFPASTRWGLYPALSLGWILSEEGWLKQNPNIDLLKIRVSYGLTGNILAPQNISEQKFSYSNNNYFFTVNSTAAAGFVEGQLASQNVKPETSYKSNIGIDAGLFGMLNLNLDLFYDQRKDILIATSGLISDVIGITSSYKNLGIVENKGIDLGLQFFDKKGDFTYNVGGQFAFVRNKIIEMGELYRPYDYLKRTGKRIGQSFGLEAVGFFKDAGDISSSPKQMFSQVKPGDIKYKDQNDDGIIDQYDEIAIGFNSTNPEIYFSASFSLDYKGIGLDALFQGVANHTVTLSTKSVFWPLRGENNISGFSDDRWTPATAATATLPRLSMEENENNYRSNSVWLRDGSFLKLRSLELHYQLPKQFVSKFKLDNARLYLRGMNLLSFDKIKILDPEEIRVVYPTLSSYNLGIQISF